MDLKVHLLLFGAFLIGFLLRIRIINQYGLSDDEILKVLAAREYMHFNFSANAQHPFLNKLGLTISILIFGENEFALRLPNAIFSSLTVYPIFLVGEKLFSKFVGICSAYLWSVNIAIIGFSTVAKEDSMLTFFWVLAMYAFLRSFDDKKYLRWTGIFVGLAFASKYTAVLLVIVLCAQYFDLKKHKVTTITLLEIMKQSVVFALLTFFIFNFPILLPETWKNLSAHYFKDYRIDPSHTGYLMMGDLFIDRPWYFPLLFLWVKLSVIEILTSAAGIFLVSKKDGYKGRYVLYWIAIPIMVISARGGYVRYLMVIIPAILILSAKTIEYTGDLFSKYLNRVQILKIDMNKLTVSLKSIISILIIINIAVVGLRVSPYYRIYANEFGGGEENYGFYFPGDTVYDYKMDDAIRYLNQFAEFGATIAIHHTILGEYYGRDDLNFVFLIGLPENITEWVDMGISYVIVQDSRTYVETQSNITAIRLRFDPEQTFSIDNLVVVEIYHI